MPTYAIGDLQGCFDPLQRLLDRIRFDPASDRLWFVGDLVNRGPDSLRCLRLVKSLGEAATTVLGNHDLHLLCVAGGFERARPRDTLEEILGAPDREPLLDWLRHRPLMHVEGPFAMVHAGLLPEWSIARARDLALEVEAALAAPDHRDLLAHMYGDEPRRWSEGLQGYDRLRVVINAMTRLRVLDRTGAMALAFKGEPGEVAEGCNPWFAAPERLSRSHTVVCGHWSAMGLLLTSEILSLDSGCVWGRRLSAVRLPDRSLFEVACPEPERRAD